MRFLRFEWSKVVFADGGTKVSYTRKQFEKLIADREAANRGTIRLKNTLWTWIWFMGATETMPIGRGR